MTFALAILQCEPYFSITMGNEGKRIEEFLGRCILLDRFCRRTLPYKTNTSGEKKAWGICHAYLPGLETPLVLCSAAYGVYNLTLHLNNPYFKGNTNKIVSL